MADRITVLNPMGFAPEVTRKELAPRLATLDGKTVYLVDCRFDDSDVFLKQMQAWFAEHMPGVQTVVKPISSVYLERRSRDLGGDQGPGPRRDRRRRPLKHLRAGGRRARDDDRGRSTAFPPWPCTPTSSTASSARWRRSNGMPGLRQVVRAAARHGQDRGRAARLRRRRRSDHRPARHAGGRRGPDPALRRDGERGPLEFDRSTPRLVEPDTEDDLQRLFLDNHWTDMLPIVLPTEERVAAMLAGTRPQARRGRRPHALHALPRVLGVHGREGRGERGDGGRAARVLPGDPGPRRHRRHARGAAARARWRPWRWSTARSATRSA